MQDVVKGIQQKADDNIKTAQRKYKKKQFDQKRSGPRSKLTPGTKVLLKNMRNLNRKGGKMDPKYMGPYTIGEVKRQNRVTLVNSAGVLLKTVYSTSQLKLLIERTDTVEQTTEKKQKNEQLPSLKRRSSLSGLKTLKTSSKPTSTPVHSVQIIHEEQPNESFSPISATQCKNLTDALNIPFVHRPGYSKNKVSGQLKEPKKVQRIRGDGNCLFRSIAFSLSGSEASHKKVRDLVVDHMRTPQVQALLENYLGQNVRRYMDESGMEIDGVWATDAEIMGAAHLLQIDIVVYSQNGQDKQGNKIFSWLRYPSSMRLCKRLATLDALYIANPENNHYNVVLEV